MKDPVDSDQVAKEIVEIRHRLRSINEEMDARGLKVPTPEEQQLLDQRSTLERRILELQDSLVDPTVRESEAEKLERTRLKNPPIVPPV